MRVRIVLAHLYTDLSQVTYVVRGVVQELLSNNNTVFAWPQKVPKSLADGGPGSKRANTHSSHAACREPGVGRRSRKRLHTSQIPT